MKLRLPPVNPASIFDRHKPPFRVMYHEFITTLNKEKTKWSRLRFMRGADAYKYCIELVLEEEHVTSAHVFTDSGGYFICGYTKEGQERIQERELAKAKEQRRG